MTSILDLTKKGEEVVLKMSLSEALVCLTHEIGFEMHHLPSLDKPIFLILVQESHKPAVMADVLTLIQANHPHDISHFELLLGLRNQMINEWGKTPEKMVELQEQVLMANGLDPDEAPE